VAIIMIEDVDLLLMSIIGLLVWWTTALSDCAGDKRKVRLFMRMQMYTGVIVRVVAGARENTVPDARKGAVSKYRHQNVQEKKLKEDVKYKRWLANHTDDGSYICKMQSTVGWSATW
jgi:hypothetical protein